MFFIAKVWAKDSVYIHVYIVFSVQGPTFRFLDAFFAGRGGWPWQPETQ